MTLRFLGLLVAAVVVQLFTFTLPALSQDFPAKPVRLVIPYPPAGGIDIMGRVLAEQLARRWGQPVVVENKPGGGTIIGAESLAKAAPDGYSLMLTTDATTSSNPHLYAKLPYDAIKDFVPITQLIIAPQVVIVHPSVGAATMQELVTFAKRSPNALNYASYGNASQPHLMFESFNLQTGTKIASIPYKGVAPAIQAVVAGEVQVVLVPPALSRGFVHAGKLKALAVTGGTRLDALPEVPTLTEAGFKSIDPLVWFGLFAPAGTPRAVVNKVYTDVAAVFGDRDFRDRHVIQKGYLPVVSVPDEFAAFVRLDMGTKGQMIRSVGIRPE